jgi:hypothetical protein
VSSLFVVSVAAPLPIQVSDCSVPPAVFVAQKQAQKKIQVFPLSCCFLLFSTRFGLKGSNRCFDQASGSWRRRCCRNCAFDGRKGVAKQNGEGESQHSSRQPHHRSENQSQQRHLSNSGFILIWFFCFFFNVSSKKKRVLWELCFASICFLWTLSKFIRPSCWELLPKVFLLLFVESWL